MTVKMANLGVKSAAKSGVTLERHNVGDQAKKMHKLRRAVLVGVHLVFCAEHVSKRYTEQPNTRRTFCLAGLAIQKAKFGVVHHAFLFEDEQLRAQLLLLLGLAQIRPLPPQNLSKRTKRHQHWRTSKIGASEQRFNNRSLSRLFVEAPMTDL